jgi:hypothetical protein
MIEYVELTLNWPELSNALKTAAERDPVLRKYLAYLGRGVRLAVAVDELRKNPMVADDDAEWQTQREN